MVAAANRAWLFPYESCTRRLDQLTSNTGCLLNKAAAEANFLLQTCQIAFFFLMKIDSDGADVCLSVCELERITLV